MGFNIRIIWNCLSVFLIASTIYLTRSIFVFRQEADKIGLSYNPWSDLSVSIGVLLIIIIIRTLATVILKPTFVRRLKEVDELNFEIKKDRVTKEFLSFLWYVFATVYGNVALFRHPYIPSWLLGGGTCDAMIRNYGTLQGDPVINKYYLIQSAHHLYSLLDHVFIAKKQKDWAEMSLHHLCAMAAIFFSYFTNQVAFGATILLIHDYGDIFLNLGKFLRDLKVMPQISYLLDICYVFIVVTWFVPRVVLVSTCVLPAGIYTRHFDLFFEDPRMTALMDKMFIVDILQIFLVAVIMVLNLWWSWVIVCTGYNKFISKKSSGFTISSQGEKMK